MLFFGLGVDFGTHLGLRHLEEAKQGKSFKEALLAAMLGEGPSIMLSAICAALAFLAFVPTTYTGLAEFGIISALGMLVAVVVTFTVQPALMALMPPRPKPGMGVTIGIGGWIERNHRIVLVARGARDRGGRLLSRSASQIDTNPLNLQNPNTESVQTYRDLARDPDTSPYALNVDGAEPRRRARSSRRSSPPLPGVAGVRWIDDFVPTRPGGEARRDRGGEGAARRELLRGGEAGAAPTDAELAEAFASDQGRAPTRSPRRRQTIRSIRRSSRPGKRSPMRWRVSSEKRGTEPAGARRARRGADARDAGDRRRPAGEVLGRREPVTIDDIPDGAARRNGSRRTGGCGCACSRPAISARRALMKAFTESVQAVAPQRRPARRPA